MLLHPSLQTFTTTKACQQQNTSIRSCIRLPKRKISTTVQPLSLSNKEHDIAAADDDDGDEL